MKKLYTWGLMLALFAASSCQDKFLNQQPIGAYNDATLLTPDGIRAGLTSAYSLLNGAGGTNTATPPSQPLFGTIRGGEAHKGSDNSDSGYMLQQQGFDVNTNNDGITSLFQYYYNGVDLKTCPGRTMPQTEQA